MRDRLAALDGGKFANGAITGAFAYAAGTEAEGGNGQQQNNPSASDQMDGSSALDGLADLAGKIWSLPNTALGLTIGTFDGLIGVAMGQIPEIGFGQGAIQISNLPNIWGFAGAITFGDVQLYTGVSPTTMINNSNYTGEGGFSFEEHEGGHTIQSDVLGPLFFPLYGIGALTNGWNSNPFETHADYHAAYGTSALPW